ncbi:hypothetical protein ACIQMR_24410 [Streptomyces sp. NPDC091376]|uniref:hypothetical protein n=1 Tax=Streptomyces sp. NPDC091376 TaxID=3365994 RepID=UPI00380E7291
MQKKQKVVLAAAAAAVLAAVPATLVIQDRVEAAAVAEERKSLELAALKIFQRDADRPAAYWRTVPAPGGMVWDRAVARAQLSRVEKEGHQAKVWVSEITTPYASDPSGGRRQATTPYAAGHLFVFEPSGDGWRLAKDLTRSELAGNG